MNQPGTQQQILQSKREPTLAEKIFIERTGKAPLLQGFKWQRGPSVLDEWIRQRRNG